MIPIETREKKTIAIHVARTDAKGTYPARRAAILASVLSEEANVVFLTGPASPPVPEGFREISIGRNTTLSDTISVMQPDLLLRDSGSTLQEEVAKIREVVPSIIHFDDFGDGGRLADLVLQTLYEEESENVMEHYVMERNLFIADETFNSYQKIGLQKDRPSPIPHLIISFGEEDPGNLSYRALRHVLQLQIPLKVSVLVGELYSHDISTLRMMALGRRNTKIIQPPYDVAELYSRADIILCGSGYMPYEVAVMGIPCIVLAQNEFELGLGFPKEHHGFIHLGLGRKVKQSNLLNAIMEPLLHEPLRKRAIRKQTQLNLGNGKDTVLEAIRYLLEYPKRDKAMSDMLH
ncbi:PseG/SpsG family protein [Sporosarcina sp. Te-1]|uniref:PseG/SpsG family protein n=1 Tax=Sporosarcina sp. Te-1 TaxID=2818390 RepID=UPI001A9E6376|nr:CMP-N-acetylneuraminic acid synthetase [Sporosarcina sp. Te-1]QTD40671.1 CMP-N-acetylneuraminic acid synthetase [Sporosarcina sp. Te-1]